VGAPKSLRTRERERGRFHRRQRSWEQIVIEERERLNGRRRGQLVNQRAQELSGAHR
jgi:hypothetical protein